MSAAHVMLIFITAWANIACASRQNANTEPIQNPELRAFAEYADRQWPASAEQHGVTIEALARMFSATLSVAETKNLSSPVLMQRVQELRTSTTAYAAGTPGTVAQAPVLRQIFITAAAMITEFVEKAGLEKPGIDPRLTALGRAAESLDPDIVLPRQAETIERFFRHATEALRRVDRGA